MSLRQRDPLLGEQGHPYPAGAAWVAGEPEYPRDARAEPAGEDAGLGMWANLCLRLESLTAAIETQNRKTDRLWKTVHQIQVTGPALSTTAVPAVSVVDRPDILGPHTGYYWDLRRLTFAPPDPATAWAGSIWVYKSLIAPTSLIHVFTPATGLSRWWSKGQVLLAPHERLVYAAGPDFTGTAEPGGDAILVTDDCVPAYLT